MTEINIEEEISAEDQEIEELMDSLEEQDPDEKNAEEMKDKIQAIRDAKKKKLEEEEKKKWQKPQGQQKGTPRLEKKVCENCGKSFKPRKARQKNCSVVCARESAKRNAGRPELIQEEVQEKLRPFLRLWLNLKEACLESDLVYSTILDKKLEWVGFNEFIEKHQNYVVIKARKKIFKTVDDTGNQGAITARRLLAKKRAEEFGDHDKEQAPETRFSQINIIVTNKPE